MLMKLEPIRTYKTKANVEKAISKFPILSSYRYIIMTTDENRYFPVFVGIDCVQAGIHFHFNIIA